VTSSIGITTSPTSATRVLIVGSDYTDVAAAERAVHERADRGQPQCPGRTCGESQGPYPEQVAQIVDVCLAEIAAQHAHTAAVVANRCDPSQMGAVADALKRFEPKTYVLPEEPLLVAPSVAELQAAVDGTVLRGDPALLSREAMDVLVAGMTSRARAGAADRGCGRRNPRRPVGRGARRGECP